MLTTTSGRRVPNFARVPASRLGRWLRTHVQPLGTSSLDYALCALLADLLVPYRLTPGTSPDSLVVRALNDAVARVAPHPYCSPGGHAGTSGTENVKAGQTRANFLTGAPMWQNGSPIYHLFGQVTGTGAAARFNYAGTLERVTAGHFRTKASATQLAYFCDYQEMLKGDLLRAAGYTSLTAGFDNHTPGVVYCADVNGWVLSDSTYDHTVAHFLTSAAPLGIQEMLTYSMGGRWSELRVLQPPRPAYASTDYVTSAAQAQQSLLAAKPTGLTMAGAQHGDPQLGSDWRYLPTAGHRVYWETYSGSPEQTALNLSVYATAPAEDCFPHLGLFVDEQRMAGGGHALYTLPPQVLPEGETLVYQVLAHGDTTWRAGRSLVLGRGQTGRLRVVRPSGRILAEEGFTVT